MAADADRSQGTVDNDSRMGHHDPPDNDNGEGAEDGLPLNKMEPDYGEDEPARPPTCSESAQEDDGNRSGGDAPQRS
eukprot:6409439-Pyramimonas_sp.AAC.1